MTSEEREQTTRQTEHGARKERDGDKKMMLGQRRTKECPKSCGKKKSKREQRKT